MLKDDLRARTQFQNHILWFLVFKLVFHKLVIDTCYIFSHVFKPAIYIFFITHMLPRHLLYLYKLFKNVFNFKHEAYPVFWA